MKIFSGEPGAGLEKCAEFRKDHKFLWNDERCTTKSPFICETPFEVYKRAISMWYDNTIKNGIAKE